MTTPQGVGTGDMSATISSMAQKARNTTPSLVALTTEMKNRLLGQMAVALEENRAFIQQQNQLDMAAGKEKGLSAAMLDRLLLSDTVMASMIAGLREVAALPDPVGEVLGLVKRPNGIMVGRMRVPLGVIGIIYESRPNVTVDAAALCLKAGNAVILRGGSEAIHSNLALAKVLQEVLLAHALDPAVIQVIPMTDRAAITHLLQQEAFVDLIIPRGGESLIRFVAENSRIPVLKHYKGVCHIFVDRSADPAKATPIIMNSKTQRPGVCNALEGLLIHREMAASYLPVIARELEAAGAELRGCAASVALIPAMQPALPTDWGREFLDLTLVVKIVDSLDEAMAYIREYGSQHTEVIITEDYSNAQRFIAEVDASAVMVNASTRFNDGGQLGLGAEIGISTTKLHAYGPMGLEELTTRKFIVYGAGQIRA